MSDSRRERFEDEAPLSLGRRPAATRRGGPPPVTLIVSLFLLLLVGGGVRPPGGPPTPVGASVGDMKTAAPPAASQADPAEGLSIYKDGQANSQAAPTFVPPPEDPGAAPSPAPPATQPSTGAPPLAVQATPSPSAAAPPRTAPASPQTTAAAPAAPRARPARPDPIGALLAQEDAGEAPATRRPRPAASAADHPASVQIGAFSSRVLADRGWNEAAGLAPGAMAGKGKSVVAVTRDDGTTLYRTTITGFPSRAAALAVCDRLEAAGKSCIVR